MSKVTARHRLLNQNEIMILRRNIRWWNFIPYLLYRCIPFTDHRNSFWKPYTLLNYTVWEKEQELNRLAEKALKVGAEKVQAEKALKVEIDVIKNSTGNDYHYGTPYQLDTKLIKTRGTQAQKPSKDYIKVFKETVYGGKPSRSSVRDRTGHGPKYNPRRTAMTTEDLGMFRIHRDGHDNSYDNIEGVTFNDEHERGQGKRKKNKSHWSNRVKGETDYEYEDRKALQMSREEYEDLK